MVSAMLLSLMMGSTTADTLRAGDVTLTLAVGVDTVDNFVAQDGTRRRVATYVQKISRVPEGYLIVEENVGPTGATLTLDTIVVADGTLATLRHGDVTPQGRRHVVFADGRMTGIATDTLGRETPVDEAVDPGRFDYSILTLVTDRLPLSPGMEATLALHDITRGAVFATMRVVGTESVRLGDETFDAWRVEMDLGPSRVTRWVSRDTRKELRWSVVFGGREMVGERR